MIATFASLTVDLDILVNILFTVNSLSFLISNYGIIEIIAIIETIMEQKGFPPIKNQHAGKSTWWSV